MRDFPEFPGPRGVSQKTASAWLSEASDCCETVRPDRVGHPLVNIFQ